MNFTISLPGWNWLQRLVERWYPGLQERAEVHGKASRGRRFWHGIIDVTTTVERE